MILLVSAATPSVPAALNTHKFYASLAQVEYNNETKSLEVALRLFADDFELALARNENHHISLDNADEIAAPAIRFLTRHFEVRNGKGEVKKLNWVGIETQVDTVWLYFEVPLPEGVQGATLRNAVFLNLFETQVNTVIAKHGERRHDMTFKSGDAESKLLFPNS